MPCLTSNFLMDWMYIPGDVSRADIADLSLTDDFVVMTDWFGGFGASIVAMIMYERWKSVYVRSEKKRLRFCAARVHLCDNIAYRRNRGTLDRLRSKIANIYLSHIRLCYSYQRNVPLKTFYHPFQDAEYHPDCLPLGRHSNRNRAQITPDTTNRRIGTD